MLYFTKNSYKNILNLETEEFSLKLILSGFVADFHTLFSKLKEDTTM